jgi:hypothetical protein
VRGRAVLVVQAARMIVANIAMRGFIAFLAPLIIQVYHTYEPATTGLGEGNIWGKEIEEKWASASVIWLILIGKLALRSNPVFGLESSAHIGG